MGQKDSEKYIRKRQLENKRNSIGLGDELLKPVIKRQNQAINKSTLSPNCIERGQMDLPRQIEGVDSRNFQKHRRITDANSNT